MTTIVQTVDRSKEMLLPLSPERPYGSYYWVGSVTYRNTTGANRAAGSYPQMKKVQIPYFTAKQFRTVRNPNPAFAAWQNASRKYRKAHKRPSQFLKTTMLYRDRQLRYKTVWVRDERYTYETDHAYSGTRYTKNMSNGVYTVRLGVEKNHGNCKTITNLPGVSDPWTSNDGISLLGALREKVAGSGFNAAVSLGEAPRALILLAESATKLHSAYQQVRRGNPIGAAKVLTGKLPPKFVTRKLTTNKDMAAQNWLALQYGWKPLVQDAYDAAVFIDHQFRRPIVNVFRVTRYANGQKFTTGLIPYPENLARMKVLVTSRRSIVARVSEASVSRLAGLLDPAPLAWELLPFSFVADWFIPIGNYLSARGLASSLTGVYVTTHVFKLEDRGLPAELNSGHVAFKNFNGSKDRLKFTTINRTVSTSIAIPVPEFKPLSKVVSWAHATNAVALLIGLNKKGPI